MKKKIVLFILLIVAVAGKAQKNEPVSLPATAYNLVLDAPITTWDEAIPLGNGLMGGLLWGENNTIRLSLDRGDLWDERVHGEKNWWKIKNYQKAAALIAEGRADSVNKWWDDPYNGVTPTKLPVGRIEIKFPVSEMVKQFLLNLPTAEGMAVFQSGTKIKAIYVADQPVILVSIKGTIPDSVNLLSTMDVYRMKNAGKPEISSGGSVNKLGYPEAVKEKKDNAEWYIQQAAEGLAYCVYVQSKKTADEMLLAISITSTNDANDYRALAAQRCHDAIAKGYAGLLSPHIQWWKKFWQQSSVSIPDTAIQKQYNLVQYFYGAASHKNTAPMPLQGVWTAENGSLPPWKGDYHNDLNTQMTYMAYQEAGRFDEGLSYLNFLWERKKTFEAFAHDFYGTGGLACPGVMSFSGQPLGGWGQYSMSPTMSAWSAHLFYLHWLYTADKKFLAEKAYPWCSGVGECMLGLLKPDQNGIIKLPLSSSPEIFDNSAKAWLIPNSNYDLMCLKMLFLSLKEMAISGQYAGDIQKWTDAANALGDFHVTDGGELMLDAEKRLTGSHRHLSNIIGLYPFNLITIAGTGRDQQRIHASLKHWDSLGTKAWCGYSFSWMSCMQARVGNASEALRNLEIFVKAFILRNGFHANGDQTKSGYSNFTYRPFTLEGNFLAAQAVQEMLLQSWSSEPGKPNSGIIRIFPAATEKWADISFTNLRAEGGYSVSAKRRNHKIRSFSIKASRQGIVRIKNNFGGQVPVWNLAQVSRKGDLYEVLLQKNQLLEASFQ